MIREANKVKRLDWAKKHFDDDFNNVLWSDECTVQLETHRRFACRKRGEPPKNKPRLVLLCHILSLYAIIHYSSIVLPPRPKHPVKVHVWAGISLHGATQVCIFEGIMNAVLYVEILKNTLLPFQNRVFPDGMQLMQDNDPKHTSKLARSWMEEEGVNWWKTPAESLDLNPIENLWHELKEYNRREVKPRTKEELVQGILKFWETVDLEKCRKYIKHLRKVIPKIIEKCGDATGY